MIAVKSYTTSAGDERFRIRYREGEGRGVNPTSRTFATFSQADTFRKELDALGWREATERDDARRNSTGVVTLDEYAEEYFDTLSNVTAGTRVSYRRIYDRVWSVPLGHLRLDAIERMSIQRVIVSMTDAAKSPKTIKNAYGVLASILNYAVIDKLIPGSPCRGVKLPKSQRQSRTHMELIEWEEWETLRDEFPDHWLPLVTTLIHTGIRWGEAEALQIGDLRLDGAEPSLTVQRAIKWDASKSTGEVGPPKTPAGFRTIELQPENVDLLRIAIGNRPKSERVFLAPQGGHLRHRTFWSDIWRPALFRASQCEKHRVKGCLCGTAHPQRCKLHKKQPDPCGCRGTVSVPLRVHDLRHNFASWCLAEGMAPMMLKEMMGHEKVTTTLDIYGHLMPSSRRAAAMQLSTAFSRTRLTLEERKALTR